MAARKSDLTAEIQRLYRLPPEGFTPARNELAKRLRKEGHKEAAAEIQSLSKPTPSVWAVNALFERQPKKMGALLGAGERARAAQREAVSGRGAETLREAIRSARALSDELRWEAGQILAEQGRPPSRVIIERIAANLQALAFSPAGSEAAERGWLDRDLEPPGFEVLAGLQVASAPVVDLAARREARRDEEEKKKRARAPEPPKVVPVAERPRRDTKQEEAARHHKAKRKEARRSLEAAEKARREREEEKRRKQVAAAEEKVERARAEADSLREEAEEAEKAAAETRRQAETAERAAERSREKADKAAERLTRAQEELKSVREGGGGT